ncbi:MAG: DUF1134 domain-containing protein [Proteobacteria bacterium]|nr:DUF1134 domain-containing protein [Pseudomonadota bacterium]
MALAVTPAANSQTETELPEDTFDQESVLDAATGFFGSGAKGLAKAIEKVFADNGRPNAYILGNEGSAALIIGLRYGNGTMFHKIEGERKVHWTGPSIGFDAGANLSKVFVLVYNLYDTDDLFHRFPAVEGSFYWIGGVGVNYQQKGDIVLAPMRVGVGLRAGVNLGYMKYSKKKKLLPF